MIRTWLSTAIITMLLITSAQTATINVLDYGAKADGKTDDTAAFRAALDEAGKKPGNTVFVPAGKYLLADNIIIPLHTTLQGEYHAPSSQEGTTLLCTYGKGKTEGNAFIGCAGLCNIKNLRIEYPEQIANADEPTPYPYTISVAGGSSVDEVFLYNSYQGILVDEAPGATIRNVWGDPIRVGIRVDHVLDICRIENVHFNRFFSWGKPELQKWIQKNGVAFEFGRTDWQYCFNTFCYGYNIGYRFFKTKEESTNRPSGVANGNFVGIGADSANIAIDVEDSWDIGITITNGEFVAFANADESRGVRLQKGNTGNITLNGCNFWAMGSSVAEIHDGSLNMTGCNINDWAQSYWKVERPDVPCIIATGGKLNVNGCTINQGGLFADLTGDSTKAIFTGNIADEQLVVLSDIGNRAAYGTNMPDIKVKKKTKPKPVAPEDKPQFPQMPDH